MQSDVIFGFVGQIDEIVRRIKAEMKMEMRVVATGGLARMISRESKTIDKVDNFLTLTGLRVLYERNLPEPKKE
jgi:type III pantothenate kinase